MLTVLLVIFLAFIPIKAQAQENSTDYLQKRNAYQFAFVDYSEKTQVNLQYNSIATRNDEFSSLRQLIISRNEMLISYLTALRINTDTYKSVNSESTVQSQENLLNSEKWLDEQNQIIKTITTKLNLQTWLNKFAEKYPEIQKNIYTALVTDEINLQLLTLNKINELILKIQSNPNISEPNKALANQISEQSISVSSSLKSSYEMVINPKNTSRKYDQIYIDTTDELNISKNILSEMRNSLKLLITKTNE
jgi:hypothetical protein